MSLVAYANSSDEEESDYEDDNMAATSSQVIPVQATATPHSYSGHISDEDDDDYAPVDVALQELKKPVSFILSLPKPKNAASQEIGKGIDGDDDSEVDKHLTSTFAKLPMPKTKQQQNNVAIVEEDDEFLHKKAIPNETIEKPPPLPAVKGPTKILIPSLKDFNDVDEEMANKARTRVMSKEKVKGCGLLSILPQAKSEQNFAKASKELNQKELTKPESSRAPLKISSLIPDTVKNRRPAHNTEGVDGLTRATRKTTTTTGKTAKNLEKKKIPLVACSDDDSEESGDEGEISTSNGDFFSLNNKEKLPEVSINEINAMVAKRAAKIAGAATKYLSNTAEAASSNSEKNEELNAEEMLKNEQEIREAQKRYHEHHLDSEAMQALVGSNAKRRRRDQQHNSIQVMDISSDQVLPNRDEWMRTALASSTTYQPTGVLVDEEPVAGTRRKHQITYLAHKAKANEAELQAMWSANRQNRRATQSKYGF